MTTNELLSELAILNKRREEIYNKLSKMQMSCQHEETEIWHGSCAGYRSETTKCKLCNKIISSKSEEEVCFLRGLINDDRIGWMIYADWLDENANGGGLANFPLGISTLSEKIRNHVTNHKNSLFRKNK